jgi:hypothetical protein
MRATLANLEKEEAAIVADFKAGSKHGHSMRQHLYNIRKFLLWEALDDCDGFESYVKLKRLPMDPATAFKIAKQGEVEQHIESGALRHFSGRALTAIGTLRLENDDGTRSQEIDVRKVKRVAKRALSLIKEGESVTPALVKKAEKLCYGEKLPKPLGEQLENKIGAVTRFKRAIEQLPEDALTDANSQYPGVVTRLAKAYSDVASVLRKGLK